MQRARTATSTPLPGNPLDPLHAEPPIADSAEVSEFVAETVIQPYYSIPNAAPIAT